MHRLLIITLILMLIIPGAAFADNGTPANPFDIKPISPEELAAKVTEVGKNVVELGQGLAPPAMWISFIVAAILIFIGLPLMAFTKKIASAGIMLLIGMAIMYALVFHPGAVVGIVKGVFSGQ